MEKRWPWYLIAVLSGSGSVLYVRLLSGENRPAVGTLRELILGGALFMIATQIPVHLNWRRKWILSHGNPQSPSKGASFYYVAGLIQLFAILIFLNLQIRFRMVDAESLSILLFGISVALSMLFTSQKLAPVSDEDQRNKEKMDRLGLPHRASDAEMTRTALIVLGAGVIAVLILAISIAIGSTDVTRGNAHVAWWVSIPTLGIVLALIALSARK